MGKDKMREEFEAWAAENGMAIHLARGESGLYGSPVTQRYWGCWQASRAAVVVELPQVVAFEAGYDSIRDNEYAALPDQFSDFEADEVFPLHRNCEVRKAIEAAGLQVKP